MTTSPTITVVIPAYNSAHWVADAIDSVLAQTYRPAQVIVVDDGSTDATRARVAAYADRGVEYVYQANAGVSAARNAGIARATGDLIAFLDADDVWHPRKLSVQAAVLAARPELGLLGTDVFDWPGTLPEGAAAAGTPDVRTVRWAGLVVRNYFATSSIVVRRRALEQVGLFDTALQGPEDHDLWLRVAEHAATGIVSSRLTGYRSHEAGLGSRPRSMEAGMRRILDKLTERRAWRGVGGWLLRRKARAYLRYSCAYLYGVAGQSAPALRLALGSLVTYPVPFARHEVSTPLARVKLLAALLWRALRPKSPGGAAVRQPT